uniref:Uncharacterized protein n=1 Tax=Heterorhabditis bacteriophora TaxID=37862 RepID=A0A1I7XB19_HETBA
MMENKHVSKVQESHQKELFVKEEVDPSVRTGKLSTAKMNGKELMMEQLKASIEAEKNRPKKAAKPRVSLLPPRSKVATPQKENEGGECMIIVLDEKG